MLRRALRLWPRAVAHTPVPISAFPSRHVPAIRTGLRVRTLAGPGGAAAQEKAGSGVALGMDKGRTDITRALWERRTRASNRKIGTDTPVIVEKSPADSLQRVPIPFVSDHLLRAQYVNFRDHIRFGKLLEDLDAFAANVAHAHCDDGMANTRPVQLVTACVDSVEVFREVETLIDMDLELSGVVSWVGRSSIEVQAVVASNGLPALTATFLMVAKDPLTGSPTQVNRLRVTSEEERARWEQGERRKERRAKERQLDLFVTPPLPSEVGLLHEMLLEMVGASDVEAARSASRASDEAIAPVTMADTRIWGSRLMQPQEMNSSNNIFGGYLMRIGYEVAKANALTFVGRAAQSAGVAAYPLLLAVNDITFAHPVSIGNLVELSSRVVYAHGGCFQVRLEVKAEDLNHNASPHTPIKTNVLHFTFACKRQGDGADELAAASGSDALDDGAAGAWRQVDASELLPVPRIKPENYRQGVLVLDGRRHMMAAKAEALEHKHGLGAYFPADL